MIQDLRTYPDDKDLHFDIALVGAGPVGLCIAQALEKTGQRIVLIESGGAGFDRADDALNRVENMGEPKRPPAQDGLGRGYSGDLAWLNDVPPFELRNRGVGGSTHTWVGKCAAFDEIDFQTRDWLGPSGWPLTRADLMPAMDRAAKILNLGPNLYDDRLWSLMKSPAQPPGFNRARLRSFFWQFSHERDAPTPMRFSRLGPELAKGPVTILTHGTVAEVDLDPADHSVTGLQVFDASGKRRSVAAKTVVLCAGGIENPRLLLASDSVMKTGIGNGADVVGRYLADHPRTTLCEIRPKDIGAADSLFNFYGVPARGRTKYYLHGVRLSPDLQRAEGLTNCAAYPTCLMAKDDPWTAIRRLARGSGASTWNDIRHVARAPGLVARGLFDRVIRKRGLPRKVTAFKFDAMVEQSLDPESRVTLSDKRDAFGRPLAKVHWTIGEVEIRTVKRMAQVMVAEFERAGLPAPVLADWIAQDDPTKAPFMDMAHPSCTTRAGRDPATSVVDQNLMVHGVQGLFIAGSSVFPTPGHANPTLMILTLALRLADHLAVRAGQGLSRPAAA